MANRPQFEYQPPKVKTGDLRTPVKFYKYQASSGPEPGEEQEELVHSCFAEIYSPSMKDRDVLNTVSTERAVTINIRDTKGEYLPSNKDYVLIDDYRYKDLMWNIVEVRDDFANNAFITILLAVYGHGQE